MMWEEGTFLLPLVSDTVVESKPLLLTERLSIGEVVSAASQTIYL
jgi:hypothetical protein